MKNILFIIISIFICGTLYSQGINFQGVARSSNGVILANQNIALKVSILNKSETGNAEYIETRIVTTNAQGIFSIVIGSLGAT